MSLAWFIYSPLNGLQVSLNVLCGVWIEEERLEVYGLHRSVLHAVLRVKKIFYLEGICPFQLFEDFFIHAFEVTFFNNVKSQELSQSYGCIMVIVGIIA